ncbi:MAG: PTS sugar transporter subunit IIB [bacterium]
MKILLCCRAGVTSNMFAAALKDEAAKQGLEVMVWAAAETAVEYSIDQADIVLVTPQLRSSLTKFEDLADSDTPVIMISEEDFGSFNVEKVLKEALSRKGA